MSYKQKFIDAYNSKKERKERDADDFRQEQTERTRKEFLERFKFEPDEVDFKTVKFEDVEIFLDTFEGVNHWAIVGNCYECGARVRSPSRWSIADIGEMIVDFKPDYSHTCPIPQPAKGDGWEQRLIDAIRDAVQEAQPGREG